MITRNTLNLASCEQSVPLWRHLLDRVEVAASSAEHFLRSWFAYAPVSLPDPNCFAERWIEMIQYALQSPAWNRGNNTRVSTRLWGELLGGNLGQGNAEWIQSISLSLHRHEQLLVQATELAIQRPETLNQLAESFQQPVWAPLRVAILEQFANSPQAQQAASDELLSERVASFLVCCWENHEAELKRSTHAGRSFKALLAWANSSGSQTAEALSERIANIR